MVQTKKPGNKSTPVKDLVPKIKIPVDEDESADDSYDETTGTPD